MSNIFRLIFVGFLLCASALTSSAEQITGPIEADVIRVIDGDTIEVNAHVWVGQYVRTKVRLLGVDTPEIRRPKCEAERAVGQEAKAFVEASVGNKVKLYDVKMGSFGGRVIARLETESGVDLGQTLTENALAVAYKADEPWCIEDTQAGLLVKVKAGG